METVEQATFNALRSCIVLGVHRDHVTLDLGKSPSTVV